MILLHKVDAYDNVLLLRAFDSFSRIELFKPAKKFAVRSSFYLVAKDVRPNCELAKEAVIKWKEIWFMATFGGEEGTGVEIEDGEEVVREVLDVFGERLIKLGRPIWKIQRDALHRAEFFR